MKILANLPGQGQAFQKIDANASSFLAAPCSIPDHSTLVLKEQLRENDVKTYFGIRGITRTTKPKSLIWSKHYKAIRRVGKLRCKAGPQLKFTHKEGEEASLRFEGGQRFNLFLI